MTYQLTAGSTILRLSDNAFIPPDPDNSDYQAYLLWLNAGNTPEPTPEPEPQPDYPGFYDSLLISGAYQKIRQQALTSLPLTLAAVEFIAAMGDAKLGRPNVPALQACLGNIYITATDLEASDWAEVAALLVDCNLAETYQLPN